VRADLLNAHGGPVVHTEHIATFRRRAGRAASRQPIPPQQAPGVREVFFDPERRRRAGLLIFVWGFGVDKQSLFGARGTRAAHST
jgi:hypothetical protein